MAARLELYALLDAHRPGEYDTDDFERALAGEHPELRPVGFVSASDDDEQLLYDVLGPVAEHDPVFDTRTQGFGRVPVTELERLHGLIEQFVVGELAGLVAGTGARDVARAWCAVIARAVHECQLAGQALGWRMRYDKAVDDGPDEFPTAWSGG